MRVSRSFFRLFAIAYLLIAALRSPTQSLTVSAPGATGAIGAESSGSLSKPPAARKASSASELPTTTSLTATGSAGNYTLTAAVGSSNRNGIPSGKVQFFDTTNGNALLGTKLIGGGPVSLGFYNSANPTVGYQPILTATGDFNGDGYKDVAVIAADNTLTMSLGKGNGTFDTAAPVQLSSLGVSAASNSTQIFVADFTGNGRDDLLLGNVILLRNADGTFSSFLITSNTVSGLGDFNKDGIVDYVAADGNGNVQTFLGKGDGTFQLIPSCNSSSHNVPCQTPNTSLSGAVAVGDFNHDGILDLAFGASSTGATYNLSVVLGSGDGTFTVGPISTIAFPTAGSSFPYFLAAADFNNDGQLDLVASHYLSGTVSILLGNGDATFKMGEIEPVPAYPEIENLVIGDYNGDGQLDIAYVTVPQAGTLGAGLTVLQGNGDGTFSTTSIPTQTPSVMPFTLSSADFNEDGLSDLVTADLLYCVQYTCSHNVASVFLGQIQQTASITNVYLQGVGTHQVETVYSGDTKYLSSTSNPVPLDGSLITTQLTLTASANPATAGSTVTFTGYVQALYGSGVPTGTITATLNQENMVFPVDSTGHASYSLSGFPVGAYTISANYSGDTNYAGSTAGLVERIVGGTGSTNVASITILSGADQSAAVGTALAKPIVVQATSLNGAAVAGVPISFVGAGLTFSSATATTNSAGQVSVTAKPTLGGTLTSSASVTITGLFVTFKETGIAIPATTQPSIAPMAILPSGASAAGASLQAAVADLNGDGIRDLVLTDTIDATASLLLGKGDGTFQTPFTFAVGNGPYGVATGDFNGDGKLDVAAVNGLDNTVSILLNSASGLPAKPSFTYPAGGQPYGVSVADLNRDGIPDLIVTNDGSNAFSVHRGIGNANFLPAAFYPTGSYPFVTAVADMNNDGYPDLVVQNFGDNTVGVYLNTGAGTFLPQATYATGAGPFGVATGDFNGDGYPDVAVANLSANTLSVLLNDKTGKLLPAVSYAAGSLPTSVVAADLNGDGVLDLGVANLGDGTVGVLLGKGDGTFLPQTTVAAGTQPYSLVAADFNGDGKPDLAVTSFFSNTLGVLLQTPAATAGKVKGAPKPVVPIKTVPLR